MTRLSDIPIAFDPPAGEPVATGNLAPVLSELRQALGDWLDEGTPKTIDLLAMPFAPGEQAALLDFLGVGEVSAELRALGPSRIWETRFAGVWLADHANAAGERIALQLSITDVPELLRSQPEDMQAALAALDAELNSLASPGNNHENEREPRREPASPRS